jgi:hypothetical protein
MLKSVGVRRGEYPSKGLGTISSVSSVSPFPFKIFGWAEGSNSQEQILVGLFLVNQYRMTLWYMMHIAKASLQNTCFKALVKVV